MHKTLRRLPSLDFLRGFEAAGRRLSFTLAAEELFLTQSALSRQVKALEDALGVPLFERRHRALALTPPGAAFHRAVTDKLRDLAAAADAVQAPAREPGLTVSTTVSFASLWLIPRLATFRAAFPETDVYVSANDRVVDLARGDVDVAVRYLADASAFRGAVQLFGERLLPVASPARVKRGPPLKRPADLARHVLLHLDDADGLMPWLNWQAWLAANGEPDLKAAGAIRFSLYDQLIQAALAGEGVALGRIPLIAGLLDRGRLVAPFGKRYDSPRGYYAIPAPHAAQRPDVQAFVAWLRKEAVADTLRATAQEIMTDHCDLSPSPWIVRFAPLIPAGARVLDLAAGSGRHARFLAGRGATVVAVDRDAALLSTIDGIAGIETRVLDLEAGAWPLRGERFDAIVVVNYLHRPLLPHLRRALAPDGVLLYETFAMGNEAYGRPVNPDFLLCRDELLTVAALPPDPMTVVAFEQGLVSGSSRTVVVQRLAALGAGRAWPPVLAPASG